MRTFILLLLACLFLATDAWTQSARVQIIHNSPDPSVDIYVNGVQALDNFAFRTATPFLDLPAGINLTVAVAPASSTSVAEAIATFPVNFEAGRTYAITASGVVGDMDTPFTLLTDDNARETAGNPAKVDLSVTHGSPDAPAVDVAVRTGGKLVSNLAYGSFTPYLTVDPGVYYLDVKPAGSNAIVQTFKADLSGLAGQAVRVLASGLLGGSPGFSLYAALANGAVVELPAAPVARVQVIHNSPSPTVDVWANTGLLIDNFEYRTATPFIFVPAGVDIDLGIAADTSTSAASSIAVFPVNLENGRTYVVTASGIVGDANTPFTLIVNDNGREAAADSNQVDIAVLHGATNAPAVDVDAVFVADNVISDLAYGAFTPYLGLAPGKYDFAVRAAGAPGVVASFRADLGGLGGGAATVFASGLLGGNPAFGLFAALPNGAVVELPLTPTARVQVIHNSPDPTVDVYAGNTRLLDNFAFRTATPFVTLPADRDIALGIAPANSASANDAIATFNAAFITGRTYAVTATGAIGNPARPFTLVIDPQAREAAADPGKVDFNISHGSIDAPAVDVDALGAGNLVAGLAYSDYTGYLSVDPAAYLIQVRPAGSPVVVGTFRADLGALAGVAARVFASGYLNGTPAFGLFAALPDGTVVEFPAVAAPKTARVQIIHNSPSPTVDLYANADKLLDDFAYRKATPFIDVPADVNLEIGVALANSQSVDDVLVSFPVVFEEGKTYVVTASGIVGDANTPFTLIVNDNGREAAADPNQVDIAVLHGATNAPAVDVDAVFVADNVVSNLAYGAFTPYLGLAPGKYDFAVRAAGAPGVVASFRADLGGLGGGAATVFASGLLGGNPAFGLFAALPNGAVVELPLTPTARVQVIHNSPDPTVDVYAGNTRLLDNFAFRTATPFVTLPADRDIALGIAPANSASANDAIATFNAAFITGRTYMVAASGLVGSTATPFTLLVDDQAVETGAAGSVRLSVLHGAPDAPAVDVAVRTGGLLVSNLAYGAFTPYTDVPPGVYYLDVKPAGNSAIVQTFKADLTGLGGQVVRVFASGLLNGAPGFGLFAALTNGTVVELPASPVARVQVIHNSPAPTVDVWANTGLLIDNFAFREATPFIFVPAGVNIDLAVAPDTSTSAASAIGVFPVNLENGKTYVVIAAGVVADPNTPFQLYVNADARERAADAGQVDLAVFHGAPDAPEVDVKAQGGPVLFDNIAFGEFSNYLSLAPSEYVVEITPANDNNTVVQRYLADISALGGQSATLFASGFLGGGQPGFGVWAALADGATFALPVFVSTNDLAGNLEALQLAPNPAIDQVQVRFRLNEAAALRFNIRDVSGRLVTEGDWGLVPAGSVVRDLRLDGVTPGMYQLEIVSDKGFQTQKFVVARR